MSTPLSNEERTRLIDTTLEAIKAESDNRKASGGTYFEIDENLPFTVFWAVLQSIGYTFSDVEMINWVPCIPIPIPDSKSDVRRCSKGHLDCKRTHQPRYYSIDEMLFLIDEPNQSICRKILDDNRQLFQTVQGSTNNHQAWFGGYFDHVQEIMNLAILLHERLSSVRPLPFSLSDLLLVVYFHDIEKPWKYDLGEDGQLHHKPEMQTKADHQKFRMAKLSEYGIVFTSAQENGMKYAEGEIGDYSPRQRMMEPLACVAHMCDVASARLWFNHPMESDDPWQGAERIRDSFE